MDWLQFVHNRRSIESLYTTPLDLSQIDVQTCEIQPKTPSVYHNTINLGFRITQLPEKIPKHGIWTGLENVVGVYMLFSFVHVENLSTFEVTAGQYDLSLKENPYYVEIITFLRGNPNYPVLDTADRMHVELKNNNSRLWFSAYGIRVYNIRPYRQGDDLTTEPPRPIQRKK